MANALISFREDEQKKKAAATICEQIGIDLQTYLRICITRLIEEKGVPFSMTLSEKQKNWFETLKEANRISKENGTSEMTLEEINEARKKY